MSCGLRLSAALYHDKVISYLLKSPGGPSGAAAAEVGLKIQPLLCLSKGSDPDAQPSLATEREKHQKYFAIFFQNRSETKILQPRIRSSVGNLVLKKSI